MVTLTDIRMDSLSLSKRCVLRLTVCVPDRVSSGLSEESCISVRYISMMVEQFEVIFVFMWYEAFLWKIN